MAGGDQLVKLDGIAAVDVDRVEEGVDRRVICSQLQVVAHHLPQLDLLQHAVPVRVHLMEQPLDMLL